ncbi:hypothetical protein IFM89_011380 [Coptis chinensis]|uniref:Uncharacterized protein n=1 Tax=Coptis chinensis TaxID=261450 RepID=A0A835HLT4_9MAGN|nr:hypothetical protein IFM89_011380 [Coptis chinensis]
MMKGRFWKLHSPPHSGPPVCVQAEFLAAELRVCVCLTMEAAITSDDVVRAGGFGARDDLGSLLPVAIESTDFEASLRDARDYEEPQGERNSPGNLESEKR